MAHTVAEKIDMILIYGKSRQNVMQAIALYIDRFPERNHPSRSTFRHVVSKFMESGSVEVRQKVRGRTATNEINQAAVLAAVAHDPHISSRDIASGSGISRRSVLRIMRDHKFRPYHMSLHQELHGNDFQNRIAFCQWAQGRIRQNHDFFLNVLLTDESTFTNHGQVNRHNMHYWSAENPRWIRQVERQYPWSVNVWAGIIGEHIIGLFYFDATLNGERYHRFLRDDLPLLLDELDLRLRLNMWYQHNGCPAHFSHIARQQLDNDYNNR